jgi:hypothetical protein
MGYELNKLMTQYGLATPTMLSYDGERGPDVETINEETGEVTTTPGEITFDPAKQAAFDQYQAEYQSRLQNAPMYAGSQYRTRPAQQQPQTYEDMFSMYLGRQPGDGERATINEVGTGPISDAQRQQFLRQYENEFADLGIRNTGNQLVMDQIGNYYGNILRNPDYVSNRTTPTNPVDPSAPFIERNPAAINPNPPFTGTMISTDQAYYNPEDPPVVDGEVSQTFLDFANQQDIINANLNNPLPTTGYSDAEARNIDPMALASNAQPTWANYLSRNQDVYAHANRVADAAGIPPGPDRPAFLANVAKEHFVDFGREEGRSWYKRGGPVKGYNQGTTDGPFVDPMSSAFPENQAQATGLEVQIQENINNNPQQTVVSESSVVETQPDNTEALENMLVQLSGKQVNPYQSIMDSLSGKVTEAQTGYDQKLAEMLANTRQGPDKAELYFNLASALSAPTKTGTFGESLGLAAKQFGKFASDSRKLQQSADAVELKQAASKLKSLQSRYQKIQDKASAEAVRNKEQQFKIFKVLQESGYKGQELALKAQNIELKRAQLEIDKNKPQSKFGKEALDEGLTPGTQAFFLRVQEKAYNDAKQKNEMPSWQGKSLEEKVATGNVARYSIGQLKEALRLNANAYAKDLFGYTMTEFKSLFGSDEVKLVNTRVLRNILSSEALQKLKATFGGQISDGERDALAELSGVTARSSKERERIINNALDVLDRLAHNTQKDIEWFGSPERFRAPFEGYAQYQLENFRFADDDVRRQQ